MIHLTYTSLIGQSQLILCGQHYPGVYFQVLNPFDLDDDSPVDYVFGVHVFYSEKYFCGIKLDYILREADIPPQIEEELSASHKINNLK